MSTYILQVALCWAAFYLVYWAFLRKQTFFELNRWYLLLSLAMGLVLPQLDISSWMPQQQQELAAVVWQPIQQAVTLQLIEVTEYGVSAPEKSPVINWLLLLYWGGVVISLLHICIGLWRISRIYKASDKSRKEGYVLIQSTAAHLPFSFFKGLYLSKAVEYEEGAIDKILRHELAHIRGRHSYDVLFLSLLQAFFWFNPLIYLYQSALKNLHEFIADRAVLQTTQRKEYGHLLIRQSLSGPSIALVNAFISSQLKKRIEMMTKPLSPARAAWRYLLLLPLVALFLTAFASSYPLYEVPSEGLLLTEVDQMPRFPGCEELETDQQKVACSKKRLFEFILKNMKYPTEARKAGIEGRVVLSYTVEKDGKISDVKVEKGIGGGCDEAAVALIKSMPNWIPGMKDGKPVSVQMKLPIIFEFANDEVPSDIKNGIYKVVDEMPRFPGCDGEGTAEEMKRCADKKMLEFIYQNISYPREAREKGIEGTVVASFVVGKDGRLDDPKIVRKVDESLSREVLRVIYLMNQLEEAWTPGKHEGEVKNVQFLLPIKFKLEGASDKPKANELVLKNFVVAPNPSSGSFNLKFETEVGTLSMQVFDWSGKPVWSKSYEGFDGVMTEEIEIGALPKGIYVLKITQNEKAKTEMLILQ